MSEKGSRAGSAFTSAMDGRPDFEWLEMVVHKGKLGDRYGWRPLAHSERRAGSCFRRGSARGRLLRRGQQDTTLARGSRTPMHPFRIRLPIGLAVAGLLVQRFPCRTDPEQDSQIDQSLGVWYALISPRATRSRRLWPTGPPGENRRSC